MIKGLYEVHLPIRDLDRSIEFYERLGLTLRFRDEDSAFFWITPNVSHLGLWVSDRVELPYHPSIRHFAFEVGLEDMEEAREWLRERGIETRPDSGFDGTEPFVRPYQANASLYFDDPDGNSLEFICNVPVPEHLRSEPKMSLSDWLKKVNAD